MNQKNWPKDYSDEEIRDIIAGGDSSKANGMASWKDAAMVELTLRQKFSSEKSDKRIFFISVATLIIATFGLLLPIIFQFIK